ncbi:MAG: FAD binding domain-containing protein [Tissierellia bacterium]|nr:FAD binding domain-containing protein [Tissierellia bacterium]
MVRCDYIPKTLEEALERLDKEELRIFAGGTDLMISPKKENYLFTHGLKELQDSRLENGYWIFGAGLSFTTIMEDPHCPPVLKKAISTIAAPGIRNIGTIGGNIANGSSKADAALVLVAADSKIRLRSKDHDRIVDIVEIYDGSIKIQSEEIIQEILLPLENLDQWYFEKIGPRKALAISRVSICGFYKEKANKVQRFSLAIGAIEKNILRFREIEEQIIGKDVEQVKEEIPKILKAYGEVIQPRDGRISAKYRKKATMNLIGEFLRRNGLSD